MQRQLQDTGRRRAPAAPPLDAQRAASVAMQIAASLAHDGRAKEAKALAVAIDVLGALAPVVMEIRPAPRTVCLRCGQPYEEMKDV